MINVSNIKALESVFLYESEGGSGRYTALSHCWGKMQIIRTTKDTIEQMKQSIPWASLSKTFQDAITLTRKLGVQYIWIDSLCIVQDDKYDWETESATMAAVYQNAYLTIAASSAADGSGGCFSTRENTTYFAGFLNDVEGLRNYSVHVRESFFHNEFSTDNTGIATLSNPLLGRAWTFQERGLSTRVLHFGRAELLWECRTTKDCECGRYKSMASELHIPHNLTEVLERASSVGDVSYYVQLQWEGILRSYSAKKLTVSTDKLPAMSAIASQFNKFAIAGKYLAGLWSCHLPSCLLWKVPKASRVNNIGTLDDNNCVAYSAPTWSWASVHDAAVDYSEDLVTLDFATLGSDLRINAHIVGYDCAASGANPFGEVTPGAQITIAGLATWANTVGFTDQDEALAAINDSIGRGWEYGGKWPWKLEKHATISSGGSADDEDDAQYSRVVDYFPDQIMYPASVTSSSSSLLTTERRFLCLKVITAQRHIFALVLRPFPEADGYHRVGLLEMLRADVKGDEGTSWHWFDDGAEEMVVKIL